ncbi:MAG TPA: FAD/NAD(P)-binding protein [Burkholderiaceae bacterium]|nr:FAD/NAD(P)-binding protein [Burkholderiaceae bacterium]
MRSPPAPFRRRLLAGAAAWAGAAGATGAGPPFTRSASATLWTSDADAIDRVVAGLPGGWTGASPQRGHRLREPAAWDAAASEERVGVLVVGGGIAGLAALRALDRAGLDDARLLDLEDAAGGNARSIRLGGIDCPLAAHYIPLPDERNDALLDFLAEQGLWRWHAGRRTWSERHLCHSPQERLFIGGRWVEGLLPAADASPGLRDALRRMSAAVAAAARDAEYRIPTRQARWSAALDALDAQAFDAWLDARDLRHPLLRAYLDYCCRDDYGAASAAVSAWAGIHYFAARRGFAGGDDGGEADPVLTWPEGNAWLARRMAAPRAARIRTATIARAVRETPGGVDVLAWDFAADRPCRFRARRVVLAVPLFVAARLLEQPPVALRSAVAAMRWAPWLVTNLLLDEPLSDAPGAAPAWDNVIQSSPALGYVDATHQSLDPRPGATVLTHYWALGGRDDAELQAARAALLKDDWRDPARRVLLDIAVAQPDVLRKVRRVELARYGHAMSVPRPGVRGSKALAALAAAPAHGSRIHFAHSDLSGYSVFEEAFFHGERAAAEVARAERG